MHKIYWYKLTVVIAATKITAVTVCIITASVISRICIVACCTGVIASLIASLIPSVITCICIAAASTVASTSTCHDSITSFLFLILYSMPVLFIGDKKWTRFFMSKERFLCHTKTEVINMRKIYSDINALIREDAKAKELYLAQPDYILGELNLHADSIHTINQLKEFIYAKHSNSE